MTAAAAGEEALAVAVEAALGPGTRVLERRPHPYASSFPGEVLRCRLATGEEALVLCKREAGRRFPRFGHRGGPRYEALVYREVVTALDVAAPRLHGSWRDVATGDTWLFVEFLDGALRLSHAAAPEDALVAAAGWAGRLHALGEHHRPPGLKSYGPPYYAGWARRTSRLAGHRHRDRPWLAAACEHAEDALVELAAGPRTVIHGELTPHNVLVRDGEVLPVDWETAALAAGEIDLAALTDRWAPDVRRACEAAYARARWPGGADPGFPRRLDLARLYWTLRWLGDRAQWLEQPRMLERYRTLHELAGGLGLIP